MTTPNKAALDKFQVYRPLFFENLAGIAAIDSQRLLLSDRSRGLLTEVNLTTATETIQKRYKVDDFADVNSLSYHDGYIYSIYQDKVYVADYRAKSDRLTNQLLLRVPDVNELTGITVTKTTIYLTTNRQSILAYDRKTEKYEVLGKTPGIGIDDLCYLNQQLFIVDAKEQTVYVFDLATRKIAYEILTPFENPIGITVLPRGQTDHEMLYVAYSRPSFEVYDTGDSEFKLQLRTHYDTAQTEVLTDNFVYPLVYRTELKQNIIRSNGFLVDMYYVEKLHALPEIADAHDTLEDLEWKISIPMETDRQKLLSLEPIGNFDMRIETIPTEENRKVAVFSIPKIDLQTERRVFGWKARVKMSGIRYCIADNETRAITEAERKKYAMYLRNEKQLDMDSNYVQQAAKDAVSHLSQHDRKNVLKKAAAIRDYIYTKLTYVMDQYHDGTEDILRNGEGSCGEYLNVFLSLMRLNDIPARKCGNYKVPAYKMQAGARSVFLSPDFNHVWLQFYVPDWGWVPLESSADDESSTMRSWAKRYFMSLAWYHMECRMGSYFEEIFKEGSDRPFSLSPADLATKDIKFKVIRELDLQELDFKH